MITGRSFAELNVWQRIFAEHWDAFTGYYIDKRGRHPPDHWYENVERMLSCGDVREEGAVIEGMLPAATPQHCDPATVGRACARGIGNESAITKERSVTI